MFFNTLKLKYYQQIEECSLCFNEGTNLLCPLRSSCQSTLAHALAQMSNLLECDLADPNLFSNKLKSSLNRLASNPEQFLAQAPSLCAKYGPEIQVIFNAPELENLGLSKSLKIKVELAGDSTKKESCFSQYYSQSYFNFYDDDTLIVSATSGHIFNTVIEVNLTPEAKELLEKIELTTQVSISASNDWHKKLCALLNRLSQSDFTIWPQMVLDDSFSTTYQTKLDTYLSKQELSELDKDYEVLTNTKSTPVAQVLILTYDTSLLASVESRNWHIFKCSNLEGRALQLLIKASGSAQSLADAFNAQQIPLWSSCFLYNDDYCNVKAKQLENSCQVETWYSWRCSIDDKSFYKKERMVFYELLNLKCDIFAASTWLIVLEPYEVQIWQALALKLGIDLKMLGIKIIAATPKELPDYIHLAHMFFINFLVLGHHDSLSKDSYDCLVKNGSINYQNNLPLPYNIAALINSQAQIQEDNNRLLLPTMSPWGKHFQPYVTLDFIKADKAEKEEEDYDLLDEIMIDCKRLFVISPAQNLHLLLLAKGLAGHFIAQRYLSCLQKKASGRTQALDEINKLCHKQQEQFKKSYQEQQARLQSQMLAVVLKVKDVPEFESIGAFEPLSVDKQWLLSSHEPTIIKFCQELINARTVPTAEIYLCTSAASTELIPRAITTLAYFMGSNSHEALSLAYEVSVQLCSHKQAISSMMTITRKELVALNSLSKHDLVAVLTILVWVKERFNVYYAALIEQGQRKAITKKQRQCLRQAILLLCKLNMNTAFEACM